MKKYIKTVFILTLLVSSTMYSQTDFPGGDDPNVPVDGGISALVVAGIAYGAKKVRDIRNNKNKF